MAYVSKEKKAILVAAVKAALPKGWKATFSVRHASTFIVTIRSAPLDLASEFPGQVHDGKLDDLSIQPYHIREVEKRNVGLALNLKQIQDAIDSENYNNSDIMTDYFDVGYYTDLRFGEWDKPFKDSRKILKPTKAQAKKLTKDLF